MKAGDSFPQIKVTISAKLLTLFYIPECHDLIVSLNHVKATTVLTCICNFCHFKCVFWLLYILMKCDLWQFWHCLLVKVKESHYRLGQAQSVPRGWGSQISRQLAHDGGRVVSPTHQLPLSCKEIFLVLISFRGWVDPRAIVRPEGLCQWKFPVTPLGIEPVTFRLVVQCPKQLRHSVPPLFIDGHYIICSIVAVHGNECFRSTPYLYFMFFTDWV